MKILIDTSVALDVLLRRVPWVTEAIQIWAACESGAISGALPSSALTDVFFIVRRELGIEGAFAAIDRCLSVFEVLTVDRATITAARQLPGSDFEDNVQIAAAIQAGADAIVTRDRAGFTDAPIPVYAPAELLKRLTP